MLDSHLLSFDSTQRMHRTVRLELCAFQSTLSYPIFELTEHRHPLANRYSHFALQMCIVLRQLNWDY
jgi:hypothetical protein